MILILSKYHSHRRRKHLSSYQEQVLKGAGDDHTLLDMYMYVQTNTSQSEEGFCLSHSLSLLSFFFFSSLSFLSCLSFPSCLFCLSCPSSYQACPLLHYVHGTKLEVKTCKKKRENKVVEKYKIS